MLMKYTLMRRRIRPVSQRGVRVTLALALALTCSFIHEFTKFLEQNVWFAMVLHIFTIVLT